MRKYLLFFVCSIFIFLLVFQCSQKNPDALKETKIIESVQKEILIGRAVAAKLAGLYGAYNNDKMLRYLNIIGKSLALYTNRQELDYKFGILNTEDINAYACPGGYIMVTLGALRKIENESQLAGLLCHEIAHVTNKDIYNKLSKNKGITGMNKIAKALAGGKSVMSIAFNQVVNKAMDILLKEGIDKHEEFRADRVGEDYLVMSGYDPKGLLNYLNRVAAEGADHYQHLSKTHPPITTRINKLEKYVSTNYSELKGKVIPDRIKKYIINELPTAEDIN